MKKSILKKIIVNSLIIFILIISSLNSFAEFIIVEDDGLGNIVVSSRITTERDDVEEAADGSVTESSDLELVYDGSNQIVGLRFTGSIIPQGATITNAYIQFTCDETNSETTNLTIKGHDIDDSPVFNYSSYDVSSRTTTNASVSWSPPAWNLEEEAGPNQQTPDLSTIIQEIIDRPGYSLNSAISIIITGTGERTAEAYNAYPPFAPLLIVEYTENQSPGNQVPSVDITAPSNGSNYDEGTSITVSADASDSDGSVTSVEFFVNGGSIGIDNNAPYTVNWTIGVGSFSLTARATDNEGASTTSSVVNVTGNSTTPGNVTVSSRIATERDDVEEAADGSVTESSDLEMVDDGSDQTIGLRFTGLNIPQGVTITNANIQFTCDETNSETTNLTIKGHDIDDSPVFYYSSYDVSSRATTSASVSWSPAAWNSVGEAGINQQTPNISTIIQEIVNRTNYSQNSAITIIITGTGKRTAESYNGSPSQAALLTVEYSGEPGLGNQTPSVNISAPPNGSEYDEGTNITISANASDTDGSVTNVEFFVNGGSIGIDNTAPYTVNWTIGVGSFSLTARATDNEGASTTSSVVNVTGNSTTTGNVTVSSRIASEMDDVEEASNGSISANSSDIEMVDDPGDNGENQIIGLRFTGLNIPQGVVITNAYIQFTCDETDSETTNLTIKGHDVDDSPTFTWISSNVSSRVTTSASISWNPSAWNSEGETGVNQQTPNLAAIIQEIVNRSGYTQNSAIAIIITGSGQRTAESYDGYPSQAALLTVEYSGEPGSGNQAPSINITSPSTGSEYDEGTNITISANASDSDGSVTSVEFFVNGSSIGIDNTAPYSVNWTIGVGSFLLTARATDNEGASTNSSSVTVAGNSTTPGNVTVSSRIASGMDDVEEDTDGSISSGSSDIELVDDPGNNGENQIIGLRFTGLNIPKDADISNAYIQFTCDETNSETTNLTIKGHDIDDSPVFNYSSYDVSSRTTTNASVSWSPPAWNLEEEAGPNQQTPDLSTIIQEIVNRSGYTQNSAITLIITGSGQRTAESYNGSPSQAALLTVEYSEEPGPVNQAPSVTINSPPDGTTYLEGTSITISANASDTDGSVTSVEFFVNSSSIGTDYTAPYSINWTIGEGTFSLTATATDNENASTTSSNVTITGISQQTSSMLVHENNGSNTPYPIENIRKLTFTYGNLNVILKTGSDGNFSLNYVRKLSFNMNEGASPPDPPMAYNPHIFEEVTGTEEKKLENQFLLYPNPVNKELYISFNSNMNQKIHITLLSLDGKIIHEDIYYSSIGNNNWQINVSTLNRGIYICQINNEKTINTIKFLKN